ncbi:MAG TPA: thioredoxin domain-containing protein, partial [bacterium]|nr:thioredoxin domain-containing protein [bacterium]
MPNRLSLEKSPYLLQHASNPVDWMPWGEEAFARAKAEDKLMLVSIGYSTCHWCHVMEHESFSKPAVAELMNQWLVCVKVDREERPDVDRVYMNAVMALSGSGGWPLNCFITPDGKPIYGGTYFPPQPAFQRPSWTQLVTAIGQAWKDPSQRLKMQQDSETLTAALKRMERPADAAGDLGAAPLYDVFKQLRASYDDEHGGFTNAPKFPMPGYQALL